MNNAATFDGLPEELVERVTTGLDNTVLKQLRLVNKKISRCATPTLFSEVHFGMFDDCLAKLHDLAHSHLASQVRGFTLYTDPMPPRLHKTTHRQAYVETAMKLYKAESGNNEEPTSSELRRMHQVVVQNGACAAAYARYKQLATQQGHWNMSNDKSFKAAILKLNRLVRVAIKAAAEEDGDESERSGPLWQRIERETGLSVDDFEYHWLQLGEENYVKAQERRQKRASLCMMESISALLQTPGANMLELSVSPVPPLIRWDDTVLPSATLAHVRTLSLRACPGQSVEFDSSGFWRNLSAALKGAASLKSLDLSVSGEPISSVFDSEQIWPKLEHLALKGSISLPQAEDLISGHQSTLKSLALCNLADGDLFKFLENVPRMAKLERIKCSRLIHKTGRRYTSIFSQGMESLTPFETRLVQYMLGQSDEMPDTQQLLNKALDPIQMVRMRASCRV